MSDLSVVEGRTYGPFHIEVSAAKVAEFVEATGDDPGRWASHAPPGFAAPILFEAAPSFFADEDVRPYLAVLIHTEQRFAWSRSLPVGTRLVVTGTVETVRVRAGLNLVSLIVEGVDETGSQAVVAGSTFMMASEADLPESADVGEPNVLARERNDQPVGSRLPGVGESLPPLHKSASRMDLVRYAAASRDFNPIHWDHDAARMAGLDGVIAHGLLMGAWVTQAAASVSDDEHAPLDNARLRFRKPLRPSAPVVVSGTVVAIGAATADLKLAVASDGIDLVAASATIHRRSGE